MPHAPLAIGGVGGSGTRVIARIAQYCGYFLGHDLGDSVDTGWYAALFGRRDVLLEDPEALRALAELFFRQMETPTPLTPAEQARLRALEDLPRHQHTPEVIQAWLDSFIDQCATGRPAERWGWKVPYTHVLIDKLLDWHPTLKYVHISRNGLDMAYSKNQNQLGKWGPIFLNRAVEIGPRDSLKYWCAVQRRMDWIEARFPDRVFQLSFDRLITDPASEIEALLRFIGAELTTEQKTTLASWIITPKGTNRHKDQDLSELDPEDVAYALQNTPAAHRQDPLMPPSSSPSTLEADILETRKTQPGSDNRRAYVGPPAQYDFMGATQFNLLTGLGLREEHHVVDIGCGSLRAGRYMIQYLLPERYTGIDPNGWLWREAIDTEIGQELIRIKKPKLLEEGDFRMTGVPEGRADYIVAQSIYSHTGADLLRVSLAAAATRLAPTGQFLFTAITSQDDTAGAMIKGRAAEGWLYPGCLVFDPDEITAECAEAGLHVQKLDWYHPRQTWYRATHSGMPEMTAEMVAQLGTGKPLFDNRFS